MKMWLIYIYIYTHTHIHINTHTHTHTYTHNGILAIKKNEILPFATMSMVLEGTMLSGISQRKTNTVCYYLLVDS